jgi:hypothetical protein
MSITGITEPTTSLSNARIGYNNLLTASTTAEAAAMLIPNTWERYRPTSGAKTVKFQMSAITEIDFVGIAAHNAGTQDGGVSILVSYAATIGGSLVNVENMQFNNANGALMILFDAVTAAEIIIEFNATTSGLELGVIYAGLALEMQRGIYGGHTPIVLNAKTQYQSTMSDSGNFLGRVITREGIESTYNWKHLTPEWYRENFQPFVEKAKTTPAFIKWRPDTYEDTAFGFTTADISPTNMSGGSRLMEVSFKFRGHADSL